MVRRSLTDGPCARLGRALLARSVCAVMLTVPCVALADDASFAGDSGPPAPSTARSPDSQRRLGVPKAPPAAPAPTEPSAIAGGAARTVGSLAAVLGVVAALAYGLRRLARSHGGLLAAAGPGGRAPAGVLEVLGRYPLSRAHTLILLRLDRRVLLVSQSAGGRFGSAALATLCEIDDAEEIASILVKVRDDEGDSMARRFQSALGSADRTVAETVEHAPARRTTVHPSGDRVELWAEPGARPVPMRGYSEALTDADKAVVDHKPETGADALRRRLGALRRLGGAEEAAQ